MVLVTGAAGHVGSALVRELLADGETVRALAMPGEDIAGLRGLGVQIVVGDVLDPSSLQMALTGVEAVYHLAGIISIMPGKDAPMRQVNVVGTANVARLARLAGVRRMVYVSSIHALARPPRGVPIDETVPFDPHNSAGEYDRTKAEASLVILEEVRRGLDAVIVCPTGIMGPFDFRGGAMGRQMRQWMKPGKHLIIDGHFDFIDVRDVARGMILACRKGRRGQTYLLSGERISVGQLVSRVREVSGTSGMLVRIPSWVATVGSVLVTAAARLLRKKPQFTTYALETLRSNSLISGAKARDELGLHPRRIAETIADTVRWLEENPPAEAILPAAASAASAASAIPRPCRQKVAVVTGASGGIGAIVARRLAALGYRIFLVARRTDRLDALASEIQAEGGRADVLAVDLVRPEGVQAVFDAVMETGNGIDVLVNNAGFGWYGYCSDMPWETALEMIQVNNAALAQLIVMFLPVMRGRGYGHVINVSSVAGSFPSPWAALYSATKSFIDTLTTALHRELRGSGVYVSAVRPGPVLTEFHRTATLLSAGRSVSVERFAVAPQAVAEAIVRLIRRPRSAVYVPRGLRIVPLIEFSLGWLVDRVAPFFMRRMGSQA
jgi:dihydroflavonol-4-reductase